MPDPTQSISFRLPGTLARQLAEIGARESLSPGEYARRLVLDRLTDRQTEELQSELAALRGLAEKLRDDLATATAALLVNAGKTSVADAQAWVQKNLLSPSESQ
ncbi:MAG: hypothetical protein L6R00_10455 [Phycisphaerae bacterium]|nr:hypothetical protein [Phycisphaerae bacterium]